MKIFRKGIVVILMVLFLPFICGTNVMAASGGGVDDGNFTKASCDEAGHIKNKQCTKESGGASWHIFKSSNLPTKYNGKNLKHDRPMYDYSLDFMNGGGYDGNAGTCKKDGYAYYAAYVYDGWLGKKKDRKSPVYWGPLDWGTFHTTSGSKVHYPEYHTNGSSYTAEQINNAVRAGKDVSKWRIVGTTPKKWNWTKPNFNSAEANKLYKEWVKKTSIPNKTGWFCIASSKKYKLTIKAVNAADGKPVSGIKDVTADSNDKMRAKATRATKKGLNFIGFVTDTKFVSQVDTKKIKATADKKNACNPFISDNGASINYQGCSKDVTVYAVYRQGGPGGGPTPQGDCAQWTPSSYTNSNNLSGETSTSSHVRNLSLSAYSKWSEFVYAKPKDEVNWIHCYYPGVQRVAKTKVTTNHNASEGSQSCSEWSPNCLSTPSYKLTEAPLSNVVPWTNLFNIGSTNFPSIYSGRGGVFAFGKTDVREFKENVNYRVAIDRAGKELYETIKTGGPKKATVINKGKHYWNCGWRSAGKKVCGHDENFMDRNVDGGSADSSAYVRVPYNFENTTEITPPNNDVINAGETVTIPFNITTTPRDNSVTEGYYATRVDDAKYGLEVCSDLGCFDTYSYTDDLNTGTSDENYYEGSTVDKNITISVPDIKAGSQVCVRSWIYPATSGADTNYNDNEGDHQRAYSSDSMCYVVAKKPSIQVWGGNIYTRGKINTILSKKNNLNGYIGYNPDGTGRTKYVFGSFGENGVIASKGITGFASGAGTGYAYNNNELWPSAWPEDGAGNNSSSLYATYGPGGSKDSSSICRRSTLTFANYPCSGETAGSISGIGSVSNSNHVEKDKDNILARFLLDIEPNAQGGIVLGDRDYLQANGTYYYYGGSNDLTINGGRLSSSTIQMVHSDGNVYINSDIANDDSYARLNAIPKLIVYGKNIIINCETKRIDALLVAEEKVITCNNFGDDVDDAEYGAADSDNINSEENSNQLIINGAVVAKSLIANRTYGAATGANSIVPAEIINFDPSLYLWGNVSGDDDDANNNVGELEMTYIRELSPRK